MKKERTPDAIQQLGLAFWGSKTLWAELKAPCRSRSRSSTGT